MIVAATFLPGVQDDHHHFSLFSELLGLLVSPHVGLAVVDIAAVLWLTKNRTVRGEHESPVLAVGVGASSCSHRAS
jgi:hypothetical protein